MNKNLMILMALLSWIPVVAMERIQKRPVLQEVFYHEEAKVKICLSDPANPAITYEVEIPVRLAKLIGAFNEFVEDPHFDPVWSLPNVAITIWRFIEPQLERVYRASQDASQAAQLRQEIITEFHKLDVKSLIGVICASDYLEIPILLDSGREVLEQSTPDKILWEELEELPFHIRNQIVMDKVLMLLGPVSGKELAVCRGHEGWVNSFWVTQDGKIVSGSADRTVRIWDMQGNQLAVCSGHQGRVESVYVTKDGKIVSGSRDNTVRVWDMDGNQLAVCKGHENVVNSVCVTSDSKIVSGSWDKTVRVWDIDGNQLAVCRGHEEWVSSVTVTSDSKIVSGSGDCIVRIWDIEGNQFAQCRGHENGVESVYVTIDGKIVSGSRDNTVRVWDMDGNQLAVCKGHAHCVDSVCETRGDKIVSGSLDETVRVWDMHGNHLAECRGHEDRITSVCVTHDGKIVSGSRDKTVRIWDMEGNQLTICRGHSDRVGSVCVTKDGKIVSGSEDGTVRVWGIELLDSIVRMEEDQARALWAYLRKLSGDVDKQKCWRAIEKILGEDAPIPPANINNNNNE